jgi:ribosomal protein L37E
MSLASLLLAFAPAIAARFEKPKPEKPPSYVCARCGAESFNPNDIRERYCARCHAFAELEEARAELERLRYQPYACAQNAMAQASQQMQQIAMAQNAQLQQMAMAQNAQLLAHGIYQGLGQLGQQNALAWPWHCDCSPSRSRALLGDCPGA